MAGGSSVNLPCIILGRKDLIPTCSHRLQWSRPWYGCHFCHRLHMFVVVNARFQKVWTCFRFGRICFRERAQNQTSIRTYRAMWRQSVYYHGNKRFYRLLWVEFSLFATHLPPQFLKLSLNKEKGVNTLNNQQIHSQYFFMTFLLVWSFQRDQQNVQPFFRYHARRSAILKWIHICGVWKKDLQHTVWQ